MRGSSSLSKDQREAAVALFETGWRRPLSWRTLEELIALFRLPVAL